MSSSKYKVLLGSEVLFEGTKEQCDAFIRSMEWDFDGEYQGLPAADAAASAIIVENN